MTPQVAVWRRSPDAAFVDAEGRVAALALQSLDDLGARLLTGPAAAIWRALEAHGDEPSIAAAVADDLSIQADVVREDLHLFLSRMEDEGLVERL